MILTLNPTARRFSLKNPGQKADTIIHELRGAYAGTGRLFPRAFCHVVQSCGSDSRDFFHAFRAEGIRECAAMESRLAILAIVVEDLSVTDQMNAVLHEYKDYIIGRMGIPYKAKHVCLVSIAIDAPEETIGALGGKLGRIRGLTVKTAYSRI